MHLRSSQDRKLQTLKITKGRKLSSDASPLLRRVLSPAGKYLTLSSGLIGHNRPHQLFCFFADMGAGHTYAVFTNCYGDHRSFGGIPVIFLTNLKINCRCFRIFNCCFRRALSSSVRTKSPVDSRTACLNCLLLPAYPLRSNLMQL